MKALLWIPPGTQPMAQVLDRPLVQHVVEQIVERGVRSITLLHGAVDAATAAHLGNGERWGIAITSRRVTGPPSNADFEAACGTDDGEWTLFGNAARVSHIAAIGSDSASWNTLFFDEEEGVGAWSGWAVMQSADLPGFAGRVAAGADWRAAVRETGLAIKKVFLDHPSLSAATPRDVLLANRRALDGEFPGLFFNGKERSPGVWVARAAKIAPSARLQAPCYVGEDAWIGADCRIGPYSVIAAGCVVERETAVARSVVYEGTFLGPELEVSDSCVNRNRIHNVRLGAEIEVGEAHVASALSPAAGGGLLGLLRVGH
jgi:hypothetical protein